MKFLFFIQGEGRGHMSQAITLQEKLRNSGHTVTAVFVGAKNIDQVPVFFKDNFNCQIHTLISPKFTTDKKDKGILLYRSAFISLLKIPNYFKSIKSINKSIKKYNPDALISFYEPMLGNYLRFFKCRTPSFFIGHQYFLNHSKFNLLFKNYLEKLIFRTYNKFTSTKKSTKIALSFTKENDEEKNKLYICPPLIRKEIKNADILDKDFILSYILNPGYSKDLIKQAEHNPDLNIETFSKKEINYKTPININFYPISNELFIKKLSTCSYYISTAGFDSISEAIYLQKQVRLIPTKGHIEQKYNAIDAQRAGLAFKTNSFDLSFFFKEKTDKSKLSAFKNWVDLNDNKIVKIIESKI
ncbi:MAG: hypothetical protein PF488_02420 [Patescibacteria group bacterium]|nr:hypothetical protein [Patescibacteria group bacterium]